MNNKLRYTIGTLTGLLLFLFLPSCDVHEFPDLPTEAPVTISLHFSTALPQWEYPLTESRTIVASRVVQTVGMMRYIIRLYPGTSESRGQLSRSEPAHEYVFTRNISDGYNTEFQLNIPIGEYTIMVWADLFATEEAESFYNTDNFTHIMLQGDEHQGNNDYRDVFRGLSDIVIEPGIMTRPTKTISIDMIRPLAKYEFITTDLEDFIDKEYHAAISRGELEAKSEDNAPSRYIDMSNYHIEIYYVGFMPNTFNMFTNKPSDSTTGISYPGRLLQLDGNEASLGFDYVFVNGVQSTVTVQIGIFNKEGSRISLTSPIDVPLRRSEHTLLKGRFLMQNASGGVGIDPSFNGDHNIFI